MSLLPFSPSPLPLSVLLIQGLDAGLDELLESHYVIGTFHLSVGPDLDEGNRIVVLGDVFDLGVCSASKPCSIVSSKKGFSRGTARLASLFFSASSILPIDRFLVGIQAGSVSDGLGPSLTLPARMSAMPAGVFP